MYMYACVFSKFPDQNTALVPRLSRSHEVLQLIILVFDPALVSSARLLDSLPLASFSVIHEIPRQPMGWVASHSGCLLSSVENVSYGGCC